jgi:pectate lyase
MPRIHKSCLIVVIALVRAAALVVALSAAHGASAASSQAVAALPAFPGAEGFGSTTVGGRGGRVLVVSHLGDSGPGSLRAAIEAEGPRMVVFRVGGNIVVESSLEIHNPYITIAGQTAPGGGITLRNSPRHARTPLKIETHDVIVRYIRSRPGSNVNERGTLDAITISSKTQDVYNVIVDHSSFSWATDEVVNLYYAVHDVTIQWSIISEGLDCSTHIESGVRQCHSMGMLLGSERSRNLSIHHNLFAHNRHRNPKVKTGGLVDIVNNVVYNPGTGRNWRSPSYVNGDLVRIPVNYVNNVFEPGPDSGSTEWFIDTKSRVDVYADGNAVPGNLMNPDPEDQANLVSTRHPAPPVTVAPTDQVRELVLADVGSSRGLGCDGTAYERRDEVDRRIVGEVQTGTGNIIDSPAEVGGWPTLAPGIACSDMDNDGMPDEWELQRGLDVRDSLDASITAKSGYKNIEVFLNSVHPVKGSFEVPCVRCRPQRPGVRRNGR